MVTNARISWMVRGAFENIIEDWTVDNSFDSGFIHSLESTLLALNDVNPLDEDKIKDIILIVQDAYINNAPYD